LYGDRWLSDYVRAEWQDTQRFLEAQPGIDPKFNLALTQTGSGFDAYFSQARDWIPVQRTGTATLYRREAKAAEIAER
jgi:hypothetical protein